MGQVHEERRDDGIVVIRFDNPPLGLLDGAMTVALEAMIDRLADDPAVRAVILTGQQPDVFIRHFDLAELAMAAEAVAADGADASALWSSSPFHRITRRIETMDAIVIAAINGDCMGVGFELALACDIRIAAAGDHSIGMPEMHIAMFPGGGGTARLARLLGPARAIELICTATTLDPQRALQSGMINRVVPDALAEALAMATKIASLSPSAIAAGKRIVRASVDLSIEEALTVEQRAVNARLGSDEVRAALHGFVAAQADLRHPLDGQPG